MSNCSNYPLCVSPNDVPFYHNAFHPCSLVDPGVPRAILTALIPMGTQILLSANNSGFCDLLVVMRTLAAAGDGSGHVALFQAAIVWLDQWSVYRFNKI